jgi:hypothetical protein
MRYTVTLSSFGNASHHGGRHTRKGLTLTQAHGVVARFARRGVRRYGVPMHSVAATFAQIHASHLAHAAHNRAIGRHAAALDHLQAARVLRLERPEVEARELRQCGRPSRSGFIASHAWGAHGGAFPIAYAAGVITLDRF